MTCRSIVATIGSVSAWSLAGLITASAVHGDVGDPRLGQWSAGIGVGFLTNTPDGPEFALRGHADYFVAPRLSIGPLVQYGGVGNDVVAGLSVQTKYWWNASARGKVKLVVQGGIGIALADITDTDSGAATTDVSFVIPVGVGLDYAVTSRVALTADFILNLTSLGERVSVGSREVDLHTYVVPGFFLGVRF